MDRRAIFAQNIDRLVYSGPKRHEAQRLGIERKRLWRWIHVGITRPDPSSTEAMQDLQKLADLYGLELADLWRPYLEENYPEKVRTILGSLPDEKTAALRQMIDELYGECPNGEETDEQEQLPKGDWPQDLAAWLSQLQERHPEMYAVLMGYKTERGTSFEKMVSDAFGRGLDGQTIFVAWEKHYRERLVGKPVVQKPIEEKPVEVPRTPAQEANREKWLKWKRENEPKPVEAPAKTAFDLIAELKEGLPEKWFQYWEDKETHEIPGIVQKLINLKGYDGAREYMQDEVRNYSNQLPPDDQ